MRKSNVHTLKTTTEGVEIDVYISYQDGKDDFGRPGQKPKGYMLHIQPVKREKGPDNLVITTATGWSGVKGMIENATRFSQKQMDALTVKAPALYLYHDGLTQVLKNQGLSRVYRSQAAQDAQKASYGDISYWEELERGAHEKHAYFMAEGNPAKAEEMFTRTLGQALEGNKGE